MRWKKHIIQSPKNKYDVTHLDTTRNQQEIIILLYEWGFQREKKIKTTSAFPLKWNQPEKGLDNTLRRTDF